MGAVDGAALRRCGVAGDGEMPGRISVDHNAMVGSMDPKKDRSRAQEDGGSYAVQGLKRDSLQASGVKGGLPNGIPAEDDDMVMTNGDHVNISTVLATVDHPPHLDGAWRRDIEAYRPFGVLMDRMAQKCYFNLNDTLKAMAAVEGESEVPKINGVTSHSAVDTSEPSLRKKGILLEFAHAQRDRFTKTLVLSDWSRNEHDIARLIDIREWQVEQRKGASGAAVAVGQIKRDVLYFKQPAPDIEGAIELLATGKASWVPDLGYIPPKRLTAKQLLRTLKGMNVALATRLNLHDELPPYMQDFSIANGRATFSVPGEFALDLSIADEAPDTPFYFIDLRFLFQPSVDVFDDVLRAHLEARVNGALATNGLQGCYDFLHSFILTHKINVLRSQSQELLRGKWFECVKVENMRRNLIIQYWAGVPGPKSWIEIGVGSGKQSKSRRKATPQLIVRWFRKGVEVVDEPVDFDWQDLDLERALGAIINRHTDTILQQIESSMMGMPPMEKALTIRRTTHEEDRALTMNLLSLRSPLRVSIEPVTGQYTFSPPSNAALNSEGRLNSDPTLDVPRWLASIVCAVAQEQLTKQAELLGWSPAHHASRIRPSFGEHVFHRNVFIPSPSWVNGWALGVSFALEGEKWWVMQVVEPTSAEGAKQLSNVRGIDVRDVMGISPHYSSVSLTRIEKLAMADISFAQLSQQLHSEGVAHRIEKPVLSTTLRDSISAEMYIQTAELLREGRTWKPWADGTLRLTHAGLDGDAQAQRVQHGVRLSLLPGKLPHLREHLTPSRDQDFMISETGGLAVKLHTPLGQPFTAQIRTRLGNIERLDKYVALMIEAGFKCTVVSLSRLAFTYGHAHSLTAQITLASDGSFPATLKLLPPDTNPHLRIRVLLEQGLNREGSNGFHMFTTLLPLTIPVLQTFENFEAEHTPKRTLDIRVRSAAWYSLQYKSPLPECMFTLRSRDKTRSGETDIRWHLEFHKDKSKGVSEEVTKALEELWTQGDGTAWFGVGNGFVADVDGVALALEKLDETMRRFKTAEPEPTKVAMKEEHDVIMLD